MPGLGRAYIDSAGGVILTGASSVIVEGVPVARLTSAVAGHGKEEHAGSIMVGSSSLVIVEGLPVCHTGHQAACGHILTPGSPSVRVGG
jgi:uncharacterized Zn-binding protein involved in type VI secretion